MNPFPDAGFWWQSAGVLALQVALVFLVVGVVQTGVRLPRQRRAWWSAALVVGLVLLANALAGLDRGVLRALVPAPQAARAWVVRGNLPASGGVLAGERPAGWPGRWRLG